jgi:hypothetical protein
MSQQIEPNEQERKAFIEKLSQFRSSLPQKEQLMLDAMAAAAFSPGPEQSGDVKGYGWVPGPFGPVWTGPQFYQTGWATTWAPTPFGYQLQTVATGVWTP